MKNKIRTLYYIFKYQHILKKAVFGQGITINCKLHIKGPGKVIIGNNCSLLPTPWGDEHITMFTHRPEAQISLGESVTLRATRFGSHLSIKIDNNVIIENASIYDSDFHNIDATKRDDDFNDSDRAVIIGANSYIGCECLTSKGTQLGENVKLLPTSVTGSKVVANNKILCGNPARIIN